MNKEMARRAHTAANRLIRLFRTKFTYQMPTKSANHSDNHLKGLQNTHYSKPIQCNEPLVPQNSQSNNALANAQQGTATEYQYIWISKRNVPMKTRVTYDKQKFTITNRASYQELAGIFVYYLKGRSDLNEV